MIGHLASSLQKFYDREGNKIIFINGMSLNQLALAMWEWLGFREVDPSVVSRVLKGERLFTPSQLEIFCKLLKIPQAEKEHLFYCLYLDQCSLFGVKLPESFFSLDESFDFIEKILQEAFLLTSRGKCYDVETISSLVIDNLNSYLCKTTSGSYKEKIYDLLGTALYLKGKAIGAVALPSKVIERLRPFAERIHSLAKENKNKKNFAYSHTLYSNAYYISGNYSMSREYTHTYLEALWHAKMALSYYSNFCPERLFVFRTVIISTISTGDKEGFLAVRKDLHKILRTIPLEDYVNGIHLYHTMARGEAFFGLPDPLDTYEAAHSYFGRTLKGNGVQEVGDIRNELEIYSTLKIKDSTYLKERVGRGLEVAREEGCIRHIENINKLREKLLG